MNTQTVLVVGGADFAAPGSVITLSTGEKLIVESVSEDTFTLSVNEWAPHLIAREVRLHAEEKNYQKVHGKHNGMSFPKKGRW